MGLLALWNTFYSSPFIRRDKANALARETYGQSVRTPSQREGLRRRRMFARGGSGAVRSPWI